MVILWVLSCLALLSEAYGAFLCNTPTVPSNRADSDCHCDVIAKDSDVIHLCDANVFRSSVQNIDASCEIINVPRNASKAELTKTYEKICKTLEVKLCGSRTDAKFNLYQADTFKGRGNGHCPPADYKDFKDEMCLTSEWRCTYSSDKWVPVNHQSLQLQKDKDCNLFWLSRIRNIIMCDRYPDNSFCKVGSRKMLACERKNICQLAGFVYWVSYPDPPSPPTIVTRIFMYSSLEGNFVAP